MTFGYGPKVGLQCVDVSALGQGRYAASDGARLNRQANGVPLA